MDKTGTTIFAASRGSEITVHGTQDHGGDEPLAFALAKARLLELCSRLLLFELDAPCREALRRAELLEPLQKLEPQLASWLGQEPWDERQQDETDAEFCALFVLSPETSPCASAWIGDEPARVGAAFAERVQRWCDALEISISNEPLGRVPRDHVAVLSGLLAHAWLSGPQGAPLAEEILTQGLAPWVHRFVDSVQAKTANPLYRATVRLLRILIDTNA